MSETRSAQFGRRKVASQLGWVLIVLIAIGSGTLVWIWNHTAQQKNFVVAYCAQDQLYAEPIFQEFERETGVEVRAVYDSEAVKTVGLANRLLAERSHPQCDVFWGNEELRTRQLAARNVFSKTNGWAAFGYRSRRIVINTNHVTIASAPRSLMDLTNEIWRSKIAFAYPQFGTTATHFHALRQIWGKAAWETWCQRLATHKPFIVDGNSVVVATVGRGDAWVGLTDSDDTAAGQGEGLPIMSLPINEETLLIPNTVAITEAAPHPNAARQLYEYLQSTTVLKQLIAANALEGADRRSTSVQTLKVNWETLLRELEDTTARLNEIFLR